MSELASEWVSKYVNILSVKKRLEKRWEDCTKRKAAVRSSGTWLVSPLYKGNYEAEQRKYD